MQTFLKFSIQHGAARSSIADAQELCAVQCLLHACAPPACCRGRKSGQAQDAKIMLATGVMTLQMVMRMECMA